MPIRYFSHAKYSLNKRGLIVEEVEREVMILDDPIKLKGYIIVPDSDQPFVADSFPMLSAPQVIAIANIVRRKPYRPRMPDV